MIVRPAHFVDPGIMSSLLGKGQLYLYGVFDTSGEAQAAQKSLASMVQTGDPTVILRTPDARYAVVVKSVSGKNYQQEGFAKAIGTAPQVPSPQQTIQSAKVKTTAPQRFAAAGKPAAAATKPANTANTPVIPKLTSPIPPRTNVLFTPYSAYQYPGWPQANTANTPLVPQTQTAAPLY